MLPHLVRVAAIAVIAFAAGPLPRPVAAAEMRAELKDEVAAGEAELRGALAQRQAPADLIAVRGRLARKFREAGWAKKADEQHREILKLFSKAGLAKNGGVEASWAAEAQFWVLHARFDAAMQQRIAVGKGGKPAEQLAAQIRNLRNQVIGEDVAPATPDGIPDRKGGLCGDLSVQVAAYNAVEWRVAVAVAQSRLLSHVAWVIRETPSPADQSAEDQAQWRQIIDDQARDLEVQAQRLVEAAWAELGKRNLDTPWRAEAKRELNRFLPRQHPLSRLRGEKWLSALAEELQQQLRTAGMIADIHACFDRHVAGHPDEMLGAVQVKATVAPDGVIALHEVDHADPVVGQCLRRRWSQRKDLPRGAAPIELHVRLEFAVL